MLSNNIIRTLEILGIDHYQAGVTHKADTSKINWIEESEKYSHEIDLLNMQLRAKTQEEKQAISEKIAIEINKTKPKNHDIILAELCKVYSSKKNDTQLNWVQFNKILSTLQLHKTLIYAISLSMTRENNIEGAIHSIKRLLKEPIIIKPDEKCKLLARFLTSYCDHAPKATEYLNQDEWEKHIQINLIVAKLITILNKNIDASESQETANTLPG